MKELKARPAPLQARRTGLATLIATSPSPVVVQLYPGAADGNRRLAENLHWTAKIWATRWADI